MYLAVDFAIKKTYDVKCLVLLLKVSKLYALWNLENPMNITLDLSVSVNCVSCYRTSYQGISFHVLDGPQEWKSMVR